MLNTGEENSPYTDPLEYRGFGTDKKKNKKQPVKTSLQTTRQKVWGESPRELDILGISNLTKPKATVKKQKTAQTPYEYNEQGYFVPKEEELSTWDKLKGYASELFESKDSPDGQLTYYDQASVKQQSVDYKRNAVEAMQATGKYEFLKEYSKKDRAEFVSKLVPTPKYTQKVYNQETNEYEVKPKKEVIEEIRSLIPGDLDAFASKEDYDKAFTTAAKKFADKDPALQYQKKLAQAKANTLAATKKSEIEKKYDLSNPVNVDKANKELEAYYKTILTKSLAESETLKVLSNDFNTSIGGAAEELAKEYGRSKDDFLSVVDNVKKWSSDKGFIGKAVDLYASGVEAYGSGVQNIRTGISETLLSTNHGQIAKLNNLYKDISSKSDTAPADKDLETFWKNNELSTFDPSDQEVPKTYGEAKAKLKEYLGKTNKLVDERLQDVIEKKDYIKLFDKANLKDGIQISDVVKLVAENAPNMVVSGIGAATGNPILLGISAASMFSQEYGDQYYSAIETGLREDLNREPSKQEIAAAVKAGKYADRGEAAAWAGVSSALEFASELNVIKNTAKALGLGNDAKKAVGSLFKGEIMAFGEAALNRGIDVGKSGLGEWITEGIQTGISQVSKATQLDQDLGKYIDLNEMLESANAGGIVGSVLPFAGGAVSQTVTELRNAARTVATKFDIESDLKRIDGFFMSAEKTINTKFENGELSQKEKEDELAELRNIRNTGFKMPKNLNPGAKSEAFDLLVEKRKLMSEIQDKDDALTVPQKERIKTINESLTELARNANVIETLDKNLSIAKRLAGERVIDGGVGKGSAMEIFETTNEAQEAIDSWAKANNEESTNIKFIDGMAMLSNGQIIINKERATETKAVNVGGHELLHRVLASTFNSLDKIKATELKDKFLSVLTTEERALLDERLKPYSKQDLQNDPSEYVTQFFEIVAAKELKWTDKLSDTFAKIGDIILKYFKQKGFANLEFKDGKDVYNFIKSYNKDLRRGKLSVKTQGLLEQGRAMVASGNQMSKSIDERRTELENKLANDEIDFDRFDDLMAELDKEEEEGPKEKIKEEIKKEEKPVADKEEAEAEKIVKENKGTVASEKVQAIYDSKGVDGAFDIIKLFKPIVSKLVDKRRDAPGFDKPLLTDEIETGKNGLYDLIKAYDPNSGVPLAAYINKYLPVRAIEISRRILSKEFSKEIDEGTTSYNDSMDDDYSFDSTLDEMREEEERQSGLINPLDIMGPKLSTEYSDAVTAAIESMDQSEVGSLTFAKLNDLAPEVTAKFFGTTTAKVTNAAANLATPEIAPIQKIIYENRVKLIKLLPEGAILEGTPASERLIGTGLGIPRKIQSEFYDQKERLSKGAGLIPFQLKKEITHRDFLAAFGINEDGTVIAFGGKDPRAQTMLAMIRLYGKIASNTAVRMNEKQTLEQKADLKAGASKFQFSKASTKNGFFYTLDSVGYDIDSIYLQEFRKTLNTEDKKTFDNLKRYWRGKDLELRANQYNKIWLSNAGVAFEVENYKAMNSFFQEHPELGITLSAPMPERFNSFGYDMQINLGQDKEDSIVVEFKSDSLAPIGSVSNPDVFSESIKFTTPFTGSVEFAEIMNNNERRKAEIAYMKTLVDGVDIKVGPRGGLQISAEAWKKMPKFVKSSPIMQIPVEVLSEINEGKHLLVIKGKDTVKFPGVTKPYLEKIPEIDKDTNAYAYSRFAVGSKNGKWLSISERVFFHLNKDFNQKTGYDFTNNAAGVIIESYNAYQNGQTSKKFKGSFSKSLSDDFNAILESTQGISKETEFSDITARITGANKGKFRFFVPPSAEDFLGLLYDFIGKGKKGEEHFEFFKNNLIHPYVKGVQRIDNIRANIKEGYKALKAEYPTESKKLKKKVEGKDFTYDQAVRVYLWKANDIAVPGLSDKEVMAMSNTVKKDTKLREFADKLSIASGQLKGWVEPTEYWNVESIVSDLHNATEKVGRRNILKEFIENSDEIFSPENLNKIEAALGTNYRSALEDSLFRMKNGSNQTSTDKFSSAFVSWIANANGTIMFLNTRSAILQTIAATNYLNWTDNNPVAASAAFLNQPQYWKDFAMIFNSNKLKERREGLKADVNEAEIANAVKGSKNKAKAALSYLLKIGYTPTQIADSFAIAAGGSTFYRNRVKTYEKQGLSTKEAEDKAFEDFDNATEESQQSSDPSKLSQQQASTAGRLILAFANTPMQYNRLMKKAFRDLINGRGDAKTHVSKILYYGAVQNIVFSALQNALFATLFDEEEEDEKTAKANERKYANILNGMADTILRGTGITGAIVSTAKNVVTKFFEEREKGFKGDQAKTIVAALGISPPIGSKAAKLYSAINTEKIDKDIIDKRGMDVTLDGQLNLSPSYDIAGKVVASTTNFPLDRLVDKVNNVSEVLDSRNKTWQRVALALGWKAFDVGTLNEGEDLIRAEAKAERKEESSIKAAKDRIIKKAKLQDRIKDMSSEERKQYKDSLRNVAEDKAIKRKRIWEETQVTRDSIDDAMN